MTRLLNFIRPNDGSPAHLISAEDIVRKAESLGKIKIERDWGNSTYKCEIRFDRRSGSMIWATGNDSDFFTAILKAIQEAEGLK